MGNTSSKRITSHDRAILDMKLQRDKIRQYQRKIQTVLDREHEIAIHHLRAGNKDKARLALRKKKYQEQLLEKADKQLETLEQLTSTIEFSLLERDVLYGLKAGNLALKQIHAEMSLDTVEKLMDETAEAQAYQREVELLLAGQLTNGEEEEVEDELRRIALEEEAGLQPGKVPGVGEGPGVLPALPDAPRGEPVGRVPVERERQRQGQRQEEEEEGQGERRQMIPA